MTVNKDKIRESIEFNENWWSAVQEGEMIAQDEIDEVRDMIAAAKSLLASDDAKEETIRKLSDANDDLRSRLSNREDVIRQQAEEIERLREEVKVGALMLGEELQENTALRECLERVYKHALRFEQTDIAVMLERGLAELDRHTEGTSLAAESVRHPHRERLAENIKTIEGWRDFSAEKNHEEAYAAYDNVLTLLDRKDTQPKRQQFPRQPNGEGGWTIDTKFLLRIEQRIEDRELDGPPSMEHIESVLLAVEDTQGEGGK